MRLFTFVVTAGSVAAVFSGLLFADPPGASVRTLIQVPAGLRSGIFAQDRYVNVPPGFQISVFALVPGARFTRRLAAFVKAQVGLRSCASIARETGLDDKTVGRLARRSQVLVV